MSDRIRNALGPVGENLDEALGQRVQQAIHQRHRRRQRARAQARSLLVAGIGLVLLGGAFGLGKQWFLPYDDAPQVASGEAPQLSPLGRTVRFDDGSEVTLLNDASTLQPQRVTPTETVVALIRGTARFNVVPRPARLFRAESGNVAIHVLGTVFTLERRPDRTFVAVERGHVRVSWPGGEAHLYAGGTGLFPPVLTPPEASPVSPPHLEAPPPSAPPPRPRTAPAPARAVVPAPTAVAPRDPVDDLLGQADSARRTQRPADAIGPLRLIMDRHPGDQRAPLAAFTMGRLFQEKLQAPAQAAEAYAQARALAPQGPLAEDALAREVESWAAAHRPPLAMAAARLYLSAFPNGSRTALVRRLGGLE